MECQGWRIKRAHFKYGSYLYLHRRRRTLNLNCHRSAKFWSFCHRHMKLQNSADSDCRVPNKSSLHVLQKFWQANSILRKSHRVGQGHLRWQWQTHWHSLGSMRSQMLRLDGGTHVQLTSFCKQDSLQFRSHTRLLTHLSSICIAVPLDSSPRRKLICLVVA